MGCPECGSEHREPLALGQFRCLGTVQAAADPQLGPPVRNVVCATIYQEPPPVSVPMCACQTFAIGLCNECGEPICGRHSALWAEVRLCSEHWQERSDAKRAKEEQKHAERREKHLEAKRQHDAQKARDAAQREAGLRLVKAFGQSMSAANHPGGVKDPQHRPRRWFWILEDGDGERAFAATTTGHIVVAHKRLNRKRRRSLWWISSPQMGLKLSDQGAEFWGGGGLGSDDYRVIHRLSWSELSAALHRIAATHGVELLEQ